MELEKACMTTLGEWVKELHLLGHYECNAWESWQRITAFSFHSPPDNIGYQENDSFRMTTSRYSGQTCLIISPLVGQYFDKNRTKLDKFGGNLASEPLPGQGYTALHNQLQHIVHNMMKTGNNDLTEAVNFLINKVQQLYIGDYVNHVTSQPGHPKNVQDAIVPNLFTTNYPTGSQIVSNSGLFRSAKAVIEIKTFTICKTQYKYDNILVNPADH
jgi:hypothetical protein